MNLRKTFVLSLFFWLSFSGHGSQAQANIAPLSQSAALSSQGDPSVSSGRQTLPAIRCDFRTDTALPQAVKRARLPHAAQSDSSQSPTPAFERAPDTWRDLRISRPSTFVATATAALPRPSAYLFRSGLSPPALAG